MIINFLYSFVSCAHFFYKKKEYVPTSSEEIEKLILDADRVYGWFEIVPLEADYDFCKKVNNQEWYKVKDERYNTYEELNSYLGKYFSHEIISELWSKRVYKVFDGDLYCLNQGRGINSFIQSVEYKLKSKLEKKVVYQAIVNYSKSSDGKKNQKKFEFTREKIEGRWIFTKFEFFW